MNGPHWLALLWQVPLGLAVLSFLVLVHEGGHFLLARWNGVTVKAFSIGFGPRLFGFVRGGTDYRFCAFPLGGYVQMAGENPDDVEGAQDPAAFDKASLGARAAIVVAGPAVNILFALFAIWLLSMAGVQEPLQPHPVVAAVDSAGPGAVAGLRVGDTLVSIDGRKVERVETFVEQVALRKGRRIEVVVHGGGGERRLWLVPGSHPEPRLGIGWAGVSFGGTVMAGGVIPGGAAEKAGMRAGDTLASIDGLPLSAPEQLIERVKGSEGRPLAFELGRAGGRVTIPVSAAWNAGEKRWMVGVQALSAVPLAERRYGPIEAAGRAVRVCWRDATAIFRFLGALFTREVAASNLAGPLGIMQMSGRAASEGLGTLVSFMALISINLGILNLMPLVVTDGGRLVELVVEKVRGRRANRRFMEILTNIVMYLFLALALYVSFHDVLRIPLLLR